MRRLASPTPGTSDKEQQRLRTRMEQLRKQNEWGDLSDAEYRRLRSEVEAQLLAIPGEAEKVVLFDRHRLVVQSLGDELATATPEAIQQIVALLDERVETRDRQVVGWVPTGPAEPFFDSALLSPWRPRTDSGARKPKLSTRLAGTPFLVQGVVRAMLRAIHLVRMTQPP